MITAMIVLHFATQSVVSAPIIPAPVCINVYCVEIYEQGFQASQEQF